MPSKNRSFPPLSGDFVARQRRKEEIFGGGKPPPNPHWVRPVIDASQWHPTQAKKERLSTC